MYDAHDSGTGIKQIHFPELANEVMKLLQMRMEVVPHVVLHAARRADDDRALQEEKNAFDRGRTDQHQAIANEHCLRELASQRVHRAADDQRLQERERRGADDAGRAEKEWSLVPCEIVKKTTERGHERVIVSARAEAAASAPAM